MYSIKAKGNKRAEVLIYEDVGAGWFGGVTAKQFADDLKAAGTVDQLDVRIASYGGDVIDGLAMYRLLAEHKAKVVVHIDSVAASIASVIAMAGNEIIIAEAGSVMIHDAWTIAAGNAAELRRVVEQLEASSTQIADIYAKRTGNDLAKVKKWMADTSWFYGQEAVDAGFANAIAKNVEQVAASASSMWQSVMRGRITTHLQAERHDGAGDTTPKAPHPGNADVRSALSALTDRMRQRQVSRGVGA